MKKIFYTIFCLVTLLYTGSVAYAASLISVDFIPDPLFGAQGILPGDTVKGVVQVKNQTDTPQQVVVEAVNVYDADGLGNQLDLTIKEADVIYNNTLGTFLRQGPVVLGTLAPSAQVTYEFEVSFKETADNHYEGKTLGFDVCVGFSGGELSCGDTVVSPEGGGGGGGDTSPQPTAPNLGGGGGNGPLYPQLFIYGERVTAINTENDSVTIQWTTNLLATSQVVYGLQAAGPYTLNMDAPFFGYPFGTGENPLKVTNHSVSIGGLIPGQTYVYRVISRASPPTVSYEHTFVYTKAANSFQIGGSGGNTNQFTGAANNGTEPMANRSLQGGGTSSGVGMQDTAVELGNSAREQQAVIGEAGSVVQSADDRGLTNNLAAVFAGFAGFSEGLRCFHVVVILLVLNYLLTRLVDRRRAFVTSMLPMVKLKRVALFVGLLLVETVGAYGMGIRCVVVPLLIACVVGVIVFCIALFRIRRHTRAQHTV